MTRLFDVLGLLYILLVALAPNVAWPATPAPHTTLRPTHVPSPPPYVIMCQHNAKVCRIYKLRNGAFELIETATPWPGITP